MTSQAMCDSIPLDHYSAGGVVYRKASTQDDAAIREILRSNEMDSWVRMSFEREPSYFNGENLMGQSVSVIARRNNTPHDVVGMYSMAVRESHLNGIPTVTGYLGALRVNREYRHQLSIVKNGFASVKILAKIAPLPCFTSIASENKLARRLLEANLRGMPKYWPLGEMETMAFSTSQGRNKKLLKSAAAEDIPALVEFFNKNAASYQFSPVITEAWLRNLSGTTGLKISDFLLLKNGPDVHGCVAIWDQRAFKQIIARGYCFPISLFRTSYNRFAGLTGRLTLPRVGDQLQQVFLSFLALDKHIGEITVDVVREALLLAKYRGAKAGTLGVSTKNPLGDTLKNCLHTSIYRSCIETITWDDGLDLNLDGRPPQPEVAIL
jgi:hypothetical protein